MIACCNQTLCRRMSSLSQILVILIHLKRLEVHLLLYLVPLNFIACHNFKTFISQNKLLTESVQQSQLHEIQKDPIPTSSKTSDELVPEVNTGKMMVTAIVKKDSKPDDYQPQGTDFTPSIPSTNERDLGYTPDELLPDGLLSTTERDTGYQTPLPELGSQNQSPEILQPNVEPKKSAEKDDLEYSDYRIIPIGDI